MPEDARGREIARAHSEVRRGVERERRPPSSCSSAFAGEVGTWHFSMVKDAGASCGRELALDLKRRDSLMSWNAPRSARGSALSRCRPNAS